MTRPLSNDLRERVVAAVLGGASCREAAARFDIAVSSVVKLMQRYRATGSVAPARWADIANGFSCRIAISSSRGSRKPLIFRCTR